MKLKSSIVNMEARHIPGVAKLEAECFSSPWSEKMLEEELTNACAHFIVCECDGEVCGYAGLHYIIDEGYITNIAVSEKHRRKGIASALLERLISDIGEYAFVTLEVRVSNAAAISLYERFGFENVGIRRNYYTNPSEDALLMTKFREK